MKKKVIIIAITAAVLACIVCVAMTSAQMISQTESSNEIDVANTVLFKEGEPITNRPWDEQTFYFEGKVVPKCSEMYYTDLKKQLQSRLTSEQKKELAEKDLYVSYVKTVLKLLGDLPEDTPSISLDDARRICNEIKEEESRTDDKSWRVENGGFYGRILDRFNEFAAAPDFFGGSGIVGATYYVDGDEDKVIVITHWSGESGNVGYCDKSTGMTEMLLE